MSGAQLLEFGQDLGWVNLAFPDLEIRLEKHLERVRNLPDLERLLRSMRPLFKDKRYSPDQMSKLKKLRQQAYDRKRDPKLQILKTVNRSAAHPKIQTTESVKPISQNHESPNPSTVRKSISSQSSRVLGAIMPISVTEKIAAPALKIESFSQGVLRGISNISGEHFVKNAPKMLLWLAAASLVSFFLWQQSLSLYETAGFTNALYSAAGGILMIVGFAAYHSITRSWLALFFCVYSGAYEGYLMVSGTIHNEAQTLASTIQNSPELIFLTEKAEKERVRYHELKQRYDNPESKVFHNEWFSKTHLNPAWIANSKAHEELMTKKAALSAASEVKHVAWLKIFYRLGLVFLCMMLIHRFFASWIKSPQ